MERSPGFREHPEHKIRLSRPDQEIRVEYNGQLLAATAHPLVVDEDGHDPVYYIPRVDVNMDRLIPSDTDYECPFKGHASYYSLQADQDNGEDIAWSYEEPYEEMREIDSYMAFEADKVKIQKMN